MSSTAMNPEQNRRECVVCREAEPSFIHTVSKSGVFRQLCTDCLLKEHRELFCPVCFNDSDNIPPQARVVCLMCPSITHLSCSPSLPSSMAASSSSAPPPPSFTCPPCSDPNFTFFPKSNGNDDGLETPIDMESAKALVAASKISATSMKNAAARLKDEAYKKIIGAQMAKMRAKGALQNLQELVVKQKSSDSKSPQVNGA